jgi:deoxyribodipyrimidine photolyase-related protein
MSVFFDRLETHQPDDTSHRDWLYVPYDQLHAGLGSFSRFEPDDVGIVMVETTWKGDRRPYHKQKLALILANQRQFALEQARRGVAVDYRIDDRRYGAVLRDVAEQRGTLTTMVPAERELLIDLDPLDEEGLLELVPHEGWMTTAEQFTESQDGVPWRMDAFYRRIRRDTGILMEDGSPVGGKYSFDAENREFWSGEPPAPTPPTFELDAVDREVAEIVSTRFDHHPGELDLDALPTTRDDAEALWDWARGECMEHFGPFEDAMSRRSRTLFHTRLSPVLNLHRLRPKRVVEDVVDLDIPLNSKEGFVRQVLGWREFMRHVHERTDGFRWNPSTARTSDDVIDLAESDEYPGDGGWSHWQGEAWETPESDLDDLDGGARPDFLGADRPLPPAYWGETSGLECLDEVVESVWDEGWSHHITRLMVLSNIATMLGSDPREVTDWFWSAYIDAFDWVVEPNVLGMGTFALGEYFTTKPYVSGSNYIDDMSDYCEACRFDPEETCPLKFGYWAFLDEHEEELDGNRRMALMLGTMRNRGDETRARDRRVLEMMREKLEAGEEVTEADVEEA